MVSKVKDIDALCEGIERAGVQLKVAYDVPQIYTAHFAKTEGEYISLLEESKHFRGLIGGVHLWGKSISSTALFVKVVVSKTFKKICYIYRLLPILLSLDKTWQGETL